MGIVGHELKDLAELMTYGCFKEGEMIIDTHAPQEFMYFILDGVVSFAVDYDSPCFKPECLEAVSKDLQVPKNVLVKNYTEHRAREVKSLEKNIFRNFQQNLLGAL